MHSRGTDRIILRLVLRLMGLLCFCFNVAAAGASSPVIRSLAELQNLASTNYQVIASLSVSGVVLAAESESRLVALQDNSGTVLLKLPCFDPDVRPGEWLSVKAIQITLMRDAAGVLVGTAPVVEMDGIHRLADRSGNVFLKAGFQPLCLELFNAMETGELDVAYEGPGVPLQRIPDSALRCSNPGNSATGKFRPGLNFAVYSGTNWTALPVFQALTPFAAGILSNFDVSRYVNSPPVAMRFDGFLQISQPGIYTFHLRSDDGARMYVGDPVAECTIKRSTSTSPLPAAIDLSRALSGNIARGWVSLEGKVTFASRRVDGIEMEIMADGQPVSVLIVSTRRLATTNLLNKHVKLTGIWQLPNGSRTPRLIVPGGDQLNIIGASSTVPGTEEPITTAAQVRELQPAEAIRHLHALIRGVITSSSIDSGVVEDSTGPVFVGYANGAWPNQPIVGELWEFDGYTDPAAFSPMVMVNKAIWLGRDVLPQPIRPTHEQLLDGSLDVEYVEVRGVVLEVSPSEITLLTPGQKVTIVPLFPAYPLPDTKAVLGAPQNLPGSLIRIRGVFFAYWDLNTHQLFPGRFFLGDPTICVDEPAPKDPFSVPTRHVTELLRFTSHVDELTRFKVDGQVLHAQPPEYMLMDGANGFHVITNTPVPLAEGDLVEAVGFPQLDGPSPVLAEAEARKIGSAPLPPARPLAATELSDEGNDATLVQIDAQLLNDEVRLGERVLDLQAGQYHFLARGPAAAISAALLRPGSLLRITGVYASSRASAGNQLERFELLLNGGGDIVVLKPGPWWTMRRIMAVVAILLGGLTASLIWVALLRRTVTQRTALLEREVTARQQLKQRRLLEQERARVAQDLHDDIGAGLAQIGLIGALAERPSTLPERARQYMAEVTSKSREMVTVLDEIVWAINPRHDTTSSVSGYLCDYAQEFLHPTGVVCRLETNCVEGSHALSSTHRHQLFLAFKEALTNVVKHANAVEVWVRIATGPGELTVAVEDNGKGIPPHHDETKGDGTQNMHTRIEQIGGHCEINPRPDGGTIVTFHLPTNK